MGTCRLLPGATGAVVSRKVSCDLTVPRTRRLAVVLLLNLGLVTALVAAGLAAHSLRNRSRRA